MKTGWTAGLACALALLFQGCVTVEDRLEAARTPAEIAQATADFYVHDGGDESCCVAVVERDRTVFAHAGSADEHALFRVGSLSKLFLHPVLLDLHASGRINLDRPVTAYSKLGLPPEYGTVSLRDLLMNRSGLPREFLLKFEPVATTAAFACGFAGTHIYASFDSREDFVRETWKPWWRQALRERREIYSNVGFGLLGMTVEDALGKPVEDILREELTAPLGLADTAYEPRPDQTGRVTRACAGHLPWLVRRGHDVPDHRLGDALRATGGLLTSASDCATVFARYWGVIDAQRWVRNFEAFDDEAVFGLLRVRRLPSGRRILYRSGMIYGGASFVGFDPVDRRVVVILRNVTSWPDRRGFAVMDALARRDGGTATPTE